MVVRLHAVDGRDELCVAAKLNRVVALDLLQTEQERATIDQQCGNTRVESPRYMRALPLPFGIVRIIEPAIANIAKDLSVIATLLKELACSAGVSGPYRSSIR